MENNQAPTSDPTSVVNPGSFTPGLDKKVIAALKSCYDPEIPVDIFELGLIYSVDITPDDSVHITMTLTAPACPVAGTLPGEVEAKVKMVEGVRDATVELVWDPAWRPEMMSKAAKMMLGF